MRAELLLLLLAGCTVGPDYAPPDVALPAAFEPGEEATAADEEVLRTWWALFPDPSLPALVAEALADNRDLAGAAARVREARALRRAVDGQDAPQLDAIGSVSRGQASENAFGFGQGDTFSLFEAGFDALWELDVFGRVRREAEAADAALAATEWERRDVLVSLLGEVGREWTAARSAQWRLRVAGDNITIRSDTLRLVEDRARAGLSPDLDVLRAEAQLHGIDSVVPALEAELARAEHALDLLLGASPGRAALLLGPLPENAAEMVLRLPAAPSGLPSELLLRRPDLRRAERELASSSARIGAAEARLYPSFSLTGALTRDALHSSDLDDANSRSWSLLLGVRWPLLDGGRLDAEVEAADARAEQALLAYEQSVLVALREVRDALTGVARQEERRGDLAAAFSSQRRAAAMAEELYRSGLIDFLDVLDAQAQLYLAEDALALSAAAQVTELVALYKALGGGWVAERSPEVPLPL